jgi:hypothetical protein
MEEAVWGPNRNVSTSLELSDSSSTLKTYPKKEQISVWKKTKSFLSLAFNALAVIGWVVTIVLLFDAFFLDARLIEFMLIGY